MTMCLILATTQIAFAATNTSFKVGDVSGNVGDIITVPIYIDALPDGLSNQGILGFGIKLAYDPNVLKIVGTNTAGTAIPVAGDIGDTYSLGSAAFNHSNGWTNIIYASMSDGVKSPGVVYNVKVQILSYPAGGLSTLPLSLMPFNEPYNDDVTYNDVAFTDGTVTITAPATTVTSVTAITPINVLNGTDKTAIGLPTTVGITLSDSTIATASVTWDEGTPTYNGNTEGNYVFSGALSSLPTGATNPSDLKATVTVTVGASVDTYTRFKVGDVSGNVGDIITVPIYIDTLPDGLSSQGILGFGIKLTYDPNVLKIVGTNTAGAAIPVAGDIGDTYSLGSATFNHSNGWTNIIYASMSDGVISPGVVYNVNFEILSCPSGGVSTLPLSLMPFNEPYNDDATYNDVAFTEGTVTIVAPIITVSSADTIAGISVVNGTDLTSVGLPTTAKITLSDGTTPTVAVAWDGGTPTYNGSVAADYTFSGTLTLPAGVTNPSNVKASVIVTVGSASSNYPFTITNCSIDRTSGIKALATITPVQGASNAVVVFELFKNGTEPVNIVALQKTMTSAEDLIAYFNVPGSSIYTVKVFVFNEFTSDTTSVGIPLAEPKTLQ